jgi:hypothetical protein
MIAASGNYLSQPGDCRTCTLKKRCTRAPFKKIARDINEDARNHARSLKGTPTASVELLKKSLLKFFRPPGSSRARQREGLHRFAQKRSQTFVPALQRLAVAETIKN